MAEPRQKPQKPQLPVRQLLILSICRFAEPIVLTSILPYLPEMIEYVGVRKNEVAKWVGMSSAVAGGCQALMAVPWGTASDYVGRKPIVLLCLTFTMVFSIVFGMSQSLAMLLVSRGLLGFLNGNVGIMRTMVAEMVTERELQPRAFSIMPLVWTLGSIFGPAFGGALARPAEKHPALFGGSELLKKYPFVLPNLAAACVFVVGITTGILFLRETLEAKKHRRDYGLMLGKALTSSCISRENHVKPEAQDEERTSLLPENTKRKPRRPVLRPTWAQVFTPQSNLVLLTYTLMAMHSMAFDTVIPVFLHYPKQEFHNNPDVKLPFQFVGGFGVDASTIGLFYTLTGITGMVIQFFFFPPAVNRWGVLPCLKVAAMIFPLVSFATPFTVLLPEALRNPTVFLLMFTKLGVSIIGFPCCAILLTNSASSFNVLGTLNGVGTSLSAIGRAVGPALVGAVFSFGVEVGSVVIPWWTLGVLAFVSALPIFWIVETEGLARDGLDESDTQVESDEEEHSGMNADCAVGSPKNNRCAAA